MKTKALFIIFYLCLSWGLSVAETKQATKETDINEEIKRLKAVFKDKVVKTVKAKSKNSKIKNPIKPSYAYKDFVIAEIKDLLRGQGSQYFVFVDRNPNNQVITVGYYDMGGKISIIGHDLTSTGDPKSKEKDHYETPIGVFENAVENGSYRSEGIPSTEKTGWRGYGIKGKRVWDFGRQRTNRIYKGRKEPINIRLQMHATDPVYGETKLGSRDSKGCVRISAKLNEFLDQYGILDGNYEKSNKNKAQWVLRKDRTPVSHAGKYLIIRDSRDMITGN
jgi:hypothetical protein